MCVFTYTSNGFYKVTLMLSVRDAIDLVSIYFYFQLRGLLLRVFYLLFARLFLLEWSRAKLLNVMMSQQSADPFAALIRVNTVVQVVARFTPQA